MASDRRCRQFTRSRLDKHLPRCRYRHGLRYLTTYEGLGLRINLKNPLVSLKTTPHSGSQETLAQTTPNFRSAYSLETAVNANWMAFVPYEGQPIDVWGMLVSDGSVVSPYGADHPGSWHFTNYNVPSWYYGSFNPAGYHTVVSGEGNVLLNGTPYGDQYSSDIAPRSPLVIPALAVFAIALTACRARGLLPRSYVNPY